MNIRDKTVKSFCRAFVGGNATEKDFHKSAVVFKIFGLSKGGNKKAITAKIKGNAFLLKSKVNGRTAKFAISNNADKELAEKFIKKITNFSDFSENSQKEN